MLSREMGLFSIKISEKFCTHHIRAPRRAALEAWADRPLALVMKGPARTSALSRLWIQRAAIYLLQRPATESTGVSVAAQQGGIERSASARHRIWHGVDRTRGGRTRPNGLRRGGPVGDLFSVEISRDRKHREGSVFHSHFENYILMAR